MFNSLSEVRDLSEEWRMDYNEERPHKSLGYKAPIKYAEQYYRSSMTDQNFFCQTANANYSNIEESRLNKKGIEKQKIINLENSK